MRNAEFLFVRVFGPGFLSAMMLLVLRHSHLRGVFRGNWQYLSVLAMFTTGESLLKIRYITCTFLVFQCRHLEMHKQYCKTVTIVVAKYDNAAVKGMRLITTFVTTHALEK